MSEIQLGLTPLERALLDTFASRYQGRALREQVTGAQVIEREQTGSGFFTTLRPSVSTGLVLAKDGARIFHLDDLFIESPQLAHGGDALLHVVDGRIDCLEVIALYDGGHPWA